MREKTYSGRLKLWNHPGLESEFVWDNMSRIKISLSPQITIVYLSMEATCYHRMDTFGVINKMIKILNNKDISLSKMI